MKIALKFSRQTARLRQDVAFRKFSSLFGEFGFWLPLAIRKNQFSGIPENWFSKLLKLLIVRQRTLVSRFLNPSQAS
ncbi:hypothetical protein [Halocynthiibacter styelae]|uniref:Transposase n=1 Tax=Halocynthiibacter styelae TaxID=2761955 RepID=A0A8J7IBH2_9RHOB|nr:hypothetical protein [Paenihalocynthiibacter styelae]MBI1492163.1 hypothetical protein [Paenihalocynthiibacter styelae]